MAHLTLDNIKDTLDSLDNDLISLELGAERAKSLVDQYDTWGRTHGCDELVARISTTRWALSDKSASAEASEPFSFSRAGSEASDNSQAKRFSSTRVIVFKKGGKVEKKREARVDSRRSRGREK
eukprot:CAMPEP_0206276166 /NCGR_PEP_ID=MMETSP0047_2-20121206/36153_1 /ASSEMBLY_ACC=CAM_ASM_000192 /TAXON_ID=195065 /ORGANISM="Chroomonas mesostigmatica_cf, Strain CCMP1168" /LENGTH=123 /DNA_ID=CAMNT_0053705649 /DNA_START=130 /DNA_END=498 /DNA_ORIENTATION=+